ncbi:winged helix-turn-helix domain-containing protein [Haloarcula nitratireducens]|uniref:Winged helix-turn-helix domain-containing protein n=1 Tax=Haloarcula nitratireducens TaxID=2487749 RepID=A0AAW4PH66_9EURY|nr:winged helix-turn-helix domain-containing protein [Halomicroarcula nitratireducens]MBX0296968.1 winged helix-turn-helix domain-containing protein [Halomicroarcula nitratireducens]
MGERGRKKTVSDVEILRQFALDPTPFMHPTELAETLEMSRQGVYKRLKDLEERNLLESKKVADTRNWWLTDEGRRYLSENS